MNKKYVAAFVTAFLGIGCISYFMAVVYKGDQYGVIGGAVVMVIEMFVLLITAIILYSSKETKAIGQGVFIGSAITLVIGFGVCSSV
jgi:hypothetical protein